MIKELQALLSVDQIKTDKDSCFNYGKDWLKDYKPSPVCIVFPTNQQEVAKVLEFCNSKKIAVVPSGGRTGLSGGATAINGEVVLSLEKLNSFVSVNDVAQTITVDAGVVTEKVQSIAEENGFYFPVDFSSKGSSHIGGNVATNAGGIRVLKYGSMKEWVLGLEVVLADGTELSLNGELFKNNSGYDLRSLFVGSEGTLGIITRVILRLTNRPPGLIRLLCGLNSTNDIGKILKESRQKFVDLSAFEYFPRNGLEKVLKHHNFKDPFDDAYDHYLLIEIEERKPETRSDLEEFFSSLLEEGKVDWVILSQNQKQLRELLELRELLPETLSSLHTLHKNDITVPIDRTSDFIQEYPEVLNKALAGCEVVTFGHIGDGNLHLNVLKPASWDDADFYKKCAESDKNVYSLIRKYSGSISAEHGIGLKKKPFLSYTRSEKEIELMRQIKKVFDPNNILNPGKIF